MKRLILLIALAFVVTFSFAQRDRLIVAFNVDHPGTGSVDTLTDSENLTMVFADANNGLFTLDGWDRYGIQVNIIEASGAATTTATISASLDNSKWEMLNDTMDLSTSTDLTKIWTEKVGISYRYLRVNFIQTGTAVCKVKCQLYLKKK